MKQQLAPLPPFRIITRRDGVTFCRSLSLGDMEDLNFDFQLTSAPADADGAAAAGWCVRCPKHRKKFCGGLYFSTTTGHAYVKGNTSFKLLHVLVFTIVFTSFPRPLTLAGPAEKFKNSWRVGARSPAAARCSPLAPHHAQVFGQLLRKTASCTAP